MAESISTTMLISDSTCNTDQVSHNKGGGAAAADPLIPDSTCNTDQVSHNKGRGAAVADPLIPDSTCNTDQVSHNKGGGAAVADPFPAMPILDIPLVDLSSFISSESSPERTQELQKLRLALSSFGCVQLKNHGMTSSFLDQVHEAGKHFFAFPMEEKVKYSVEGAKFEDGYVSVTSSESHSLDKRPWVDRLNLTVHPEDKRKLNLWPQNPQTFSEILNEYTANIKSLAETVLKAMAESLELAENSFVDQFGEKHPMLIAFNYYPPCPTTAHVNLGVMAHRDVSAITILLQDNQVEGLQVKKDDQWFRVHIVPHALLLIIGDQVEIMSNGAFMAPLHKVMKNAEKERMTIAVLCMPESDKEIGPVEELISEETPRLYKSVVNYVDILRKKGESVGPGNRAIDEIKL